MLARFLTVSMAVAKASEEYDKYRVLQNCKYISDFDRAYEKYLKGGDAIMQDG